MKAFNSIFLFLGLSSLTFAAAPTGRYKTIHDQMKALEAGHPQVAKVFSIGTNDDGVELYALRISTAPQEMDKSKIGQLMVATHHGNEGGSTQLAMEF